MFENITQQQLMLLIRALNSERNVIQRHIDDTDSDSFKDQLKGVEALYWEAYEHPLNWKTEAVSTKTFGDRIREADSQFDGGQAVSEHDYHEHTAGICHKDDAKRIHYNEHLAILNSGGDCGCEFDYSNDPTYYPEDQQYTNANGF